MPTRAGAKHVASLKLNIVRIAGENPVSRTATSTTAASIGSSVRAAVETKVPEGMLKFGAHPYSRARSAQGTSAAEALHSLRIQISVQDHLDEQAPVGQETPPGESTLKSLLTSWLTLLLFGLSDTAFSQSAWLLLHQNGHFTVASASPAGIHNVLDVGEQVTYGQSEQVLGILSNKPAYGEWVLYLIDKSSQRVLSSQVVTGHPVIQLSGPSPDLVLTSQFAYFVTVRYTADNTSLEQNAAGGSFDFNQLSLADGSLRTFPLPKECVNPRVVTFGDAPVVYAWEGYGVWRFNSTKPGLETLVAGQGESVQDIHAREQALHQTARVPVGAFADYVPIPGAGIFRLTRYGELAQVLSPDLSQVATPRPTMKVGAPGAILRAFPGTFNGITAVGLIRKRDDRLFFVYVDPVALTPKWRTALSPSAEPYSLFPSDSAVLYVDSDKGGIFKLSSDGATLLWKLNGPNADLFDTRILTVIHD